MTAAFGSITTAYVTYSDNAPSVAVPSGAAAGDVFIWVVQKGNGQTITPPAGFSALDTAGETSIGSGIYTFAKTADGTESGNFTGSSSAYSSWVCICWVITGVSSTIVSHNANDTYAGYVATIPCSTGSLSSSSGDFIAGVFFATDVGTTSTLSFTPPSGFTTENIGGSPILDLGNSRGVALAYKTSTGETATYTADINSTATTTFSGMGAGFVFTPSGGGGGTTVSPAGISSSEAFGSQSLSVGSVTIIPAGISSIEAFGVLSVVNGGVFVLPSAIASQEIFGALSVAPGGVFVIPSGISTQEAFGLAVLTSSYIIAPSSIDSLELFGLTNVAPGTIVIQPSGISSSEAFGAVYLSGGTIIAGSLPLVRAHVARRYPTRVN